MSELKLDKTTSISFPDGKDALLHFQITIRPDSGIYRCAMPVSTLLTATKLYLQARPLCV